jgi:hypothetical protein
MAERPLGGLVFEHEFQLRHFPRLVYSLKERSDGGGWPTPVARGHAWTKMDHDDPRLMTPSKGANFRNCRPHVVNRVQFS